MIDLTQERDVETLRQVRITEPEGLAEDPPHAVPLDGRLPDRLADGEAEPAVREPVHARDHEEIRAARAAAFAEGQAEIALADEAHRAAKGEGLGHRGGPRGRGLSA